MKNRILNLLIVSLLVFSVLVTTAQPVSAHPDKNHGLQGVISAIDLGASSLTLTPKKGADVVLKVDSSTVITRSQHPATLADLQLGDRVEANYDPSTMLAKRIKADPNLATVKGTIKAVDSGASTLTVTPKNGGADVVLNVDSSTQIMRNGAAATLADLQVSDIVQAKYNPVTFLAASIAAWPNLVMLKGTISAVDSGAGTLTVTPKSGGADVVLNVDSTTQIKRNDAAATLADLQVGDPVQAKYNAGSFLAANIWAWPNLVTLKGTISAVDTGAGTVTVTPKGGGADVVLNVDSTTVIQRNDAAATLADLKAGDTVKAKYNAVSFLAASISAWTNWPRVKGTITAVDTGAGTVTVTPEDTGDHHDASADIVLNVDSTTADPAQRRTGHAGRLAGRRPRRSQIRSRPACWPSISAAWPNLVMVKGTIKAIDTGAGTSPSPRRRAARMWS